MLTKVTWCTHTTYLSCGHNQTSKAASSLQRTLARHVQATNNY